MAICASTDARPRVSIVLPTFNRSRFLPAALASIQAQTWADWELIVVDDGSTDNTGQVVEQLAGHVRQPVRYVYRPNGGPGAARQTGVEAAQGDLLAFFDSDDHWLPHHLADSVASLDANADVDWVFSSVCIVDERTSAVINPDVFQPREARPFLRLQTEVRGPLHVVRDARWLEALLGGDTLSGFQVSVIRRRVFDRIRIPALRVAEDLALTASALQDGFVLGWLDDVHVRYCVHSGNISASSSNEDWRARLRSQRRYGHGLRWLGRHLNLSAGARRKVTRTIARHAFWRMAYNVLWSAGRRRAALRRMRLALSVWPWGWRMWKTCLGCWLRHACRMVIARCRRRTTICDAGDHRWSTSGAERATVLPGSQP